MRVEFLVENIEQYLPLLHKTLPAHSPVPVLSNILLEARRDGFFLRATDLELGVQIKIPAKIEEEGGITIPGKQFIEILSSLPKDKVQITLEGEEVIVRSRDNTVRLSTISKEEFPTLYEEKGEEISTFSPDEVKSLFGSLTFAVSLDEARAELTGVYVTQYDKYIDFVATDGYRMSLKRKEGKMLFKPGKGVILSSKIINELFSLKKASQIKMFILEAANQVLFEAEDVVLIGRLISGTYPPYERVIPSGNRTRVIIDRNALLQELRIASVFARESANIVKITITGNMLLIHAKTSGVGEGDVVVDVEKEGEDNEISFNQKFLTDLLKNSEGNTIVLEMNSSLEPAAFKNPQDPEFLHVIMPVRVQ